MVSRFWAIRERVGVRIADLDADIRLMIRRAMTTRRTWATPRTRTRHCGSSRNRRVELRAGDRQTLGNAGRSNVTAP
jgi:hypothetical protein